MLSTSRDIDTYKLVLVEIYVFVLLSRRIRMNRPTKMLPHVSIIYSNILDINSIRNHTFILEILEKMYPIQGKCEVSIKLSLKIC